MQGHLLGAVKALEGGSVREEEGGQGGFAAGGQSDGNSFPVPISWELQGSQDADSTSPPAPPLQLISSDAVITPHSSSLPLGCAAPRCHKAQRQLQRGCHTQGHAERLQ